MNVLSVAQLVSSVLMVKTVPFPKLPPANVVPYRVLPDKTKPVSGFPPSVRLKLCRFVKPVPSV